MNRRHPRRKTTAGRFAMLPLSVFKTAAVTTLSHAVYRVLTLIIEEYNGKNNGTLGLTRTQVAKRGIGSEHTLYDALRTLEAHGLIVKTYPASRVPARPTMYALTWISVDDTEWSASTRLPAHTYRDWQPSRKPTLKVVSNKAKKAVRN